MNVNSEATENWTRAMKAESRLEWAEGEIERLRAYNRTEDEKRTGELAHLRVENEALRETLRKVRAATLRGIGRSEYATEQLHGLLASIDKTIGRQ